MRLFLQCVFSAGCFFPPFDALDRMSPSMVAVVGWVVATLSYHQDAKHRLHGWAAVSQIFSVTCLIALLVFGFTRREWWNFVILPPLAWLQVQFTRRWWERPGAWW